MIVVPNALLSSQVVINHSRPLGELSVTVPVTVDYASDLDRVARVTGEVAGEVVREVAGAVPESSPSVRVHAFGDMGVNLQVTLRAQGYGDQPLLTHELLRRLHQRFRAEGIKLV